MLSRLHFVQGWSFLPVLMAVTVVMFLALHMLWDLMRQRLGTTAALFGMAGCLAMAIFNVELETRAEEHEEEELQMHEAELRSKRKTLKRWEEVGCSDEESYMEYQRNASLSDMCDTADRIQALRQRVADALESLDNEDDEGDAVDEIGKPASPTESDCAKAQTEGAPESNVRLRREGSMSDKVVELE
mmetsp:Transcript_46772/g.111245  ORF Transcript_46772/g.111245 Transcript_46772/m.111245 type:complete len:188 (-) Transcript_46772:316-879(-)